MGRRGKRRRRLRLIRWAEPLFDDDDGDHGDDCPCRKCEARDWLQPEDWVVVGLYRIVRDQVVNLTPMGDKDNKYRFAPRAEAWLSLARAHGYTPEDVEDARYLHDIISDRISREAATEALHSEPDELMPPGEDWSADG